MPVGVGAVVSGVELVLEPAEGGLVGTGGRFDGGPGDAVVQKSLDGEHLATQLTFLTAFLAGLLTTSP